MSLTKKVKTQSKWFLLIKLIGLFLKLVSIPIISRLINPDIFGQFAIILMIFEFIRLIIDETINKIIIINKGYQFSEMIIINLSISLISFLFYLIISTSFEIQNANLICLMFIISFLISITAPQFSYLEKKMEFKKVYLIKLISSFFGNVLIVIILAYNDFGLKSLVYGLILTEILATIMVILYSKVKLNKISKSSFFEIKKNLGIVTLIQFINKIATQIDYLIVKFFFGDYYLGLYFRSYKLINLPTSIAGTLINRVGLSALSNNEITIKKQKDIFLILFGLFSYSLPILYIVHLFSYEIITLLLGDEWVQANSIFKIIIFGIYFKLVYKISSTILMSNKKFVQLLKQMIFYVLGIMTFLSAGSYYFGIIGLSFGLLISLIVPFIYSLWHLKKLINYSIIELISLIYPSLSVVLLIICLKNIPEFEVLSILAIILIILVSYFYFNSIYFTSKHHLKIIKTVYK